MINNFKFIPIVGNLYLFRTDNTDYLFTKYGFYYSGLVICTQSDVFGDLDKTGQLTSIIDVYIAKKPLYSFHLFNCKQKYSSVDYPNIHEVEVNGKIYLSFQEANDMLLEYKKNK